MAVNAPDRLRAYNQIFPQSDLAAEHMPAAPTVIYGPVGQALAYGVTQGPNGGRLLQSDAAGNLKTFSNGGYETLPPPTQLNLVSSRTDTATFIGTAIASPGLTVALFTLHVTAISGAGATAALSIQSAASDGTFSTSNGGNAVGAISTVTTASLGITSASSSTSGTLGPLFRVSLVIAGSTPSVTWFLDMVYK